MRHETIHQIKGNFHIFECPACTYVRVMHCGTGDMAVITHGDPSVLHNGGTPGVGSSTEVS